MADNIFTDEFKTSPYWWDKTPRPALEHRLPPGKIDVAVIGCGYTGLNAALVTARGGRSTAIFDAGDAGFGCSTRNGGQVSTSIKPGLSELSRRHGKSVALDIIKQGHNALSFLQEFVQSENIDCDFRVSGRFHAAHNKNQFRKLTDEVNNQVPGLEVPVRLVPREEQQQEIGTSAYHGGVVYENHAAVDPAALHQGLLNKVIDAGGQIVPHCAVQNIKKKNDSCLLYTSPSPRDRG